MNKANNLKINIFFNMLKALMHIVFPIISFPYAARVLGVDNIGKVQYCTSIVSYFVLFAGLGVANYATREGTKYRNDRKKLSKFSKEILCINLVSTVISYIALIVTSLIFLQGYLTLMIVCSFLIAFTTFSIDWIYQIVEDFAYISIRTIIFQFVSLFCLLLFVKNRDDYIIYAAITVLANGGNCIFNWIHSKKYIDWFSHGDPLDFKQHLKPILIIFSISASTSIYLHLDSVMVGAMKGDHEVGLYSAATKLASVVKSMITSISAVMLSRLSYYVNNHEKDKYLELLKNAANFVLLLSIPAGIGLAALRKEILLLFCGSEYTDAAAASLILSINMIFSIVDGMIYNQIFLPLKMEKQASIATIVGAVTNFLLNLLFIHYWGFFGAAITTLLSECIVFCILSFFASKRIDISQLFSNIYQYLIGGGVIILCSLLIQQFISNAYVYIVVMIIVSMLLYVITLKLLKNQYINYALSIIKKKR